MNAEAEWYNDFFKGPFGELQVRSNHVHSTERDVARVMACLGEESRSILDAPCGAGRHSLELSRRGHRVTGVDFNPAVLEVARGVADQEGLNVRFLSRDLRELDFDAEFDAATCLWSSIGYFSDEENERTFQNLGRAVKPGGYLFIDTMCAESLFPIHRERHWDLWGEGDDRVRVCQEARWDYRTSRVEGTWYFDHAGGSEVRSMSLRVYTCHEIIQALQRAGFSEFHAFGHGDDDFRIGSPRLWLQAQKPG